jgi:hypothetical protein
MHEELHQLIRAGFHNALLQHSDDLGRAFERAVEMYVRRRPLLDRAEARAEVTMILNIAPEQLSAVATTNMRSYRQRWPGKRRA